jgi:hypothetical protein
VKSFLIGHDSKTGEDVRIPVAAFRTHFHLIGGTGKGKTTAIHAMLHPLLLEPRDKACFVIVDRMGNLSAELLLWMASRYCTDAVRRRLVYIQPSREDAVITFNPLQYGTQQEGFYKVSRATDIILRAWEDVNIEAMPRLARWTFNAFWAAAQLGLTIADCVHFLLPGSDYHSRLLDCLPRRLKYEWQEVIDAKGEASRLLESTRNRLKPYFESEILRSMFGSAESRLDMTRFMREGRIVLLNLAPYNRLSEQLGNAIGGLVINEVLAVARSLPMGVKYPTYLLLDEFQNFVGPDIESAIPEVRQLGIRLILSHQSFSQLKRADVDLTNIIWQAQSRMIFGVAGEDATILGDEIGALTYDPKRVKEENYVRRQRIVGHEIRLLKSWSESQGEVEGWNTSYGSDWPAMDRHRNEKQSEGGGASGGKNRNKTSGEAEHLVPVHEDFDELANRVFYTPEEQKAQWGRDVRELVTGQCLMQIADQKGIRFVDVKRSAPGPLAWDDVTLLRRYPKAIDDRTALIEANFRSELFVRPEVIEAEAVRRLESVVGASLPSLASAQSSRFD